MMSRILAILVIFGFSSGSSSVHAEQFELAKHCEQHCGCVPCGCASIRCDQTDKDPFSSLTYEAPVAPAGEAVKANVNQ